MSTFSKRALSLILGSLWSGSLWSFIMKTSEIAAARGSSRQVYLFTLFHFISILASRRYGWTPRNDCKEDHCFRTAGWISLGLRRVQFTQCTLLLGGVRPLGACVNFLKSKENEFSLVHLFRQAQCFFFSSPTAVASSISLLSGQQLHWISLFVQEPQ